MRIKVLPDDFRVDERIRLPKPTPALEARLSELVDLPRLTARYEGVYAPAAEAVLEAEALSPRDFKVAALLGAHARVR